MDHMEAGDYEDAAEAVNIAEAINPRDPKIEEAVDEIADKIDEEDNSGSGSSDATDSTDPVDNGDGSDNSNGGDNKLTPFPEDATALSLHIDEIDGYLSIKKAWNNEPIEASSVFLPIAREVRTEIDRVVVVIRKFETTKEAESSLQDEKDEYGQEGEDLTINNHPAYAGLNDFSTSEIFKLKQIAALTWTRDAWFFSVQVLPSPEGLPSNDYKKGVNMFGLGIPEMIVILVIAMIIFGPKRLPEVGKSLGTAIRSFKEGAEQIKTDVENSTGMDEKTRRELSESLTMKETRDDLAGLGKDLKESVSLESSDTSSDEKEVVAEKEAEPVEVQTS